MDTDEVRDLARHLVQQGIVVDEPDGIVAAILMLSALGPSDGERSGSSRIDAVVAAEGRP